MDLNWSCSSQSSWQATELSNHLSRVRFPNPMGLSFIQALNDMVSTWEPPNLYQINTVDELKGLCSKLKHNSYCVVYSVPTRIANNQSLFEVGTNLQGCLLLGDLQRLWTIPKRLIEQGKVHLEDFLGSPTILKIIFRLTTTRRNLGLDQLKRLIHFYPLRAETAEDPINSVEIACEMTSALYDLKQEFLEATRTYQILLYKYRFYNQDEYEDGMPNSQDIIPFLNEKNFSIYISLCQLRDHLARLSNCNANFILADQVIGEILKKKPTSTIEISEIYNQAQKNKEKGLKCNYILERQIYEAIKVCKDRQISPELEALFQELRTPSRDPSATGTDLRTPKTHSSEQTIRYEEPKQHCADLLIMLEKAKWTDSSGQFRSDPAVHLYKDIISNSKISGGKSPVKGAKRAIEQSSWEDLVPSVLIEDFITNTNLRFDFDMETWVQSAQIMRSGCREELADYLECRKDEPRTGQCFETACCGLQTEKRQVSMTELLEVVSPKKSQLNSTGDLPTLDSFTDFPQMDSLTEVPRTVEEVYKLAVESKKVPAGGKGDKKRIEEFVPTDEDFLQLLVVDHSAFSFRVHECTYSGGNFRQEIL